MEGSRSFYSDAAKGTLHLDDWKGTLDLIAMHARDDQQRLPPLGNKGPIPTEYTRSVFAAYFTGNYFDGHELGAYYVYKDEELDKDYANQGLPDRTVHTFGIPLTGKFLEDWDYYAEFAYQWSHDKVRTGGTTGEPERDSWALSADLGHTFGDLSWSPRVHGAYEYLSGDDPESSDCEAWDPVMARWPQWSELLGYTYAAETGMPFYYTNLQRFTMGVSIRPADTTSIHLDHSILLANEHPNGRTGWYGGGDTRGQLTVAKLTHKFTKSMSMHLWTEWFNPQSYYADRADRALFVRAQFLIKF